MVNPLLKELGQRLGSAIPTDLAVQAGVRLVSSAEALDYGFAGFGDAPLRGLLFPYTWPGHAQPRLYRLRPDESVQGRKYLAPHGSTNHIYLPLALPEMLTDCRFDALVVEGEKKALAVRATVGAKDLVMGVAGVWNWRTSDKDTRERQDGPGTETVRTNGRAVEDFDKIIWKSRRVYIVFDSDGAKNVKVQQAEQALATELRKRGALVMIVSLPPGPNGEKVGIDDWLAGKPESGRLAALRQLLNASAPRRKLAPTTERKLDLRYEPSGGVMRTFDELVDAETDAPAVYRPFVALSILGAVVGRNVGLRWFGTGTIYPNTYTALVGGSSFDHKTTLISIAKRAIRAVRHNVVLPDEFTPQKGAEILAEHPERFLGCAEFAGFLARAGRDYNAGLREFLMEMYDCPDVYERALVSKASRIEGPALTVLAASALSWLSDQMKAGDLRSGFFNRFGFVLSTPKAKSYPLPVTSDDSTGWHRLVEQLKDVGGVRGTAVLSTEARGAYERWYRVMEREAASHHAVEIVSAFDTRLAAVAVKYAVLLELSTSRDLVVRGAAMEEGIELVQYLRAVARHLLDTEFGTTDGDKRLTRLLAVIVRSRGIKRSGLLQQTGWKAHDLTPLLDTLRERGDVYESDHGWWPCE